MSKWPEVIDLIIARHPKYFCNNKRKERLYFPYMKSWRDIIELKKKKKGSILCQDCLRKWEIYYNIEGNIERRKNVEHKICNKANW